MSVGVSGNGYRSRVVNIKSFEDSSYLGFDLSRRETSNPKQKKCDCGADDE